MDESLDEVGSSPPKSAQPVESFATPFVGMMFPSMEITQNYYKDYGRANGFSTRVRRTNKRNTGNDEPTSSLMVCNREGEHKKRILNTSVNPEKPIVRRNSSTLKCGCKAQMRVILENTGKWKVSVYTHEHNHECVTPSKRIYMRENKRKPEVARSLSVAFQDGNVPVAKKTKIHNV